MANMRRATKLELKALAAIAYKKDIFAKMNKIWCRVNPIYTRFVGGFCFSESHILTRLVWEMPHSLNLLVDFSWDEWAEIFVTFCNVIFLNSIQLME